MSGQASPYQSQWQPGQQMQRPTAPGLPQDPMYSQWGKQGMPGPAPAPRPGYQQVGVNPVAGQQNPQRQPFPGIDPNFGTLKQWHP